MVRYNLYLSNNQVRALRKFSKDDGVSVSEHIRLAVTEYIDRKSYSTTPEEGGKNESFTGN